MDPETEAIWKGATDDGSSDRTTKNRYYYGRCFKALRDSQDPPMTNKEVYENFSWLNDGMHSRMTLMSELGRFEDPDDIVYYATQVCEEKPIVKDAVVLLRSIRLGTNEEPKTERLYYKILSDIEHHQQRYHFSTTEQAIQVLRLLADELEKVSENETTS